MHKSAKFTSKKVVRYFINSLLFCLFSFVSYTQSISFEDYDFTDKKIEIPEKYKDNPEVNLGKVLKIELLSLPKTVEEYHLIHEKIYVNSDDAIERNNKIYINLEEEEGIIKNKNRVILPDGKIINLDKADIHEEEDEETGRKYAYYAVKGLTKGSIVEKLLITKESPFLTGISINFESSVPIASYNFQLIYPKHLGFKYKSYNGLSEPTIIEGEDKTDIMEIIETDIPAFDSNEKFANHELHRKKFRYKLYENKVSKAKNFYNYNEFANSFYNNITVELSKKDQKKIDNFCKSISSKDNDLVKVQNIDGLIKKQIVYNTNIGNAGSIGEILDAKQGTMLSLIKLYKVLFEKFDVPVQYVFTSNRYRKFFDPDFETTNNLDEVLIYVPSIDQYVDLGDQTTRIPVFSYGFGNNNGLFIKEKEFGGAKMAVAEVGFIALPDMHVTKDSMFIVADFTKDVENPFIVSKIVFGGYAASNLQPIVDYVSKERYDEILKDVAKNYSADVELEKIETENNGLDNLGKKNFILKIELFGKELIQVAGEKYLFKIGEMIGKQSEIYQEDERNLPVEIQYPHYYYRNLKVILPKGYKISNPEQLEMYFDVKNGEKKDALFVSKYIVKDQILEINNIEYYDAVTYPLELFKDYQSVLNAAADFNKIVIVLEKE